MKTCDMDGYTEDDQGREHYWHCEKTAIVRDETGHLWCAEHADDQGILHYTWDVADHA